MDDNQTDLLNVRITRIESSVNTYMIETKLTLKNESIINESSNSQMTAKQIMNAIRSMDNSERIKLLDMLYTRHFDKETSWDEANRNEESSSRDHDDDDE